MWTTRAVFDIKKRGLSIPTKQLELVNSLRAQAFEVQQRFDLAEHSALILEQMLDTENGIADTVDNTYEAHTFVRLRMQLFRLLIVDICACVLDNDKRTGSIRSILKELRRDTEALDALRAYYSDKDCIDVDISGDDLDAEFIKQEKLSTIERMHDEGIQSINDQWWSIHNKSSQLNNDSAKRMLWARNKAIAHFEKKPTGIVALHDTPPYGDSDLTWIEPVEFLQSIRPFVYDVFALITATSWGDDTTKINQFYAKAFWDRFKSGNTDMRPYVDISDS